MPDQTVKVSVKVAETALDATEIEVKAEETALLGVTLKNDVEVVGYQATITLPEGLSLEKYEGEDVMYNDDRLSINVVANVKKQGESNSYIIMLSSLTNDVFEGNEGLIFALNLLAGKDFQGGEVKFTDIKIATKNGMSYDLEDELTATITVKPEFEDVTGDGIWNIDDVYDVLKVMAGTLEEEGEQWYFEKGTSCVRSHTVSEQKLNKGDGKQFLVVVYSTAIAPLKSGESLIKFKVKADESLAEKAEIQFKEVMFNGGQYFEFTGEVKNSKSTGIKDINAADRNEGVSYNIAGQRISKDAKGLHIVNGKKYINR